MQCYKRLHFIALTSETKFHLCQATDGFWAHSTTTEAIATDANSQNNQIHMI